MVKIPLTTFQPLVERVQLAEALFAERAATAVAKYHRRHPGRRGAIITFLMGLGYYLLASLLTVVASVFLVFLLLLLRVVIPLGVTAFSIGVLASTGQYLILSNLDWYAANQGHLLLNVFRPALSDQFIAGTYAVIPVILFATIYISLYMVLAITYRKGIFEQG